MFLKNRVNRVLLQVKGCVGERVVSRSIRNGSFSSALRERTEDLWQAIVPCHHIPGNRLIARLNQLELNRRLTLNAIHLEHSLAL